MLFSRCTWTSASLTMQNQTSSKSLNAREHERAKELQLQHKWTHLWAGRRKVHEHQHIQC